MAKNEKKQERCDVKGKDGKRCVKAKDHKGLHSTMEHHRPNALAASLGKR